MKLFSGSAHPILSQEVSKLLKIPLSKSEVIQFGNSEIKVTIQENVKDQVCTVIQPTSNPTDTHIMELIFFCDALKRNGAKKVIGIIPYFGYARQNIQHRKGECVSVNVVIRFLETIGFGEIIAFDLHDEGTSGIFSIPFTNMTSLELIAEEIKQYLKADFKHAFVVSPDQGGVERAQDFADYLFNKQEYSIGIIEKKRNLSKIHESKALGLFGDVKGKTVILVDDVITSGGTLIHAAELCKKKGAKKVIAAIAHHDFMEGAAERLENSTIDAIFCSNSIELKKKQKFPKLYEVSIAPLIVQQLKRKAKSV
jgi:ribose-phosphate pyrophosphokinase